MSFKAINWVQSMQLGDPSARFVAYMLANYADEAGCCFPAVSKLADDTDLSERTVRKAIKRLEERGLVKIVRKRNSDGTLGRNHYRLALNAPPKLSQPAATAAGGEPAATDNHPAATDDHPAATAAGPIVKQEPPIEPPIEPLSERERADARAAGGEESFRRRFWAKWPNRAVDSRSKALSEWVKLDPDDWDAAIDGITPFHEKLNAAGRRKAPAAATYLIERKWEDMDADEGKPTGYVQPQVQPGSALWTVTLIELLRTGQHAKHPWVCKQLCEQKTVYQGFGAERDAQLAVVVGKFEEATAGSERGQAFLGWLRDQLQSAPRLPSPPDLPDDFLISLPPAALCDAWGIPMALRSRISADTTYPRKMVTDAQKGSSPVKPEALCQRPGEALPMQLRDVPVNSCCSPEFVCTSEEQTVSLKLSSAHN